MDQVPLPFIVNQEFTFATTLDNNVHIRCPLEALRKRQFTIQVVVNAGKGDKRGGFVDIVYRGKGLRITNAEKCQWDERVKVFWQKNAWVDKDVMREMANRFVTYKRERHGCEKWVDLFCDNLKAHLDEEVKGIFSRGHVSLCYFPPDNDGDYTANRLRVWTIIAM